MFNQKKWLVILVSTNSLQLMGLAEETVQIIPLPASIIASQEILNKDGLYTLITDWVKQRTYTSAEIIWLLSPEVCFDYLLTTTEQDKVDSETLQFLDSVPFENILSRIYSTPEGRVITAVNKDLLMALVQSFSLHGYTTKAVIPVRDSTLTQELFTSTVKRSGELSRDSLLALTPSTPKKDDSKAKSHSSLPLLLGVFGVLLAILIIVIVLSK